MDKRQLGHSDLYVTSVCLGSMTWGEQNSETEAHQQLDYAISVGINFIDTAEMYPIPGKAETQGRTERYIGSWIAARGKRDDVIIGTKVTGRSAMAWCREGGGMTRHSPAQIDEAVEKSLRRLSTDYIDLYQLHWPDRAIPPFGFHSYRDYDSEDMVPFEDILGALQRHVEKGNIRYIGVSNETPWGMMTFAKHAEMNGLPRIVSNQHVYSLLARRYDYSHAEISLRENISLLAYSPLAMGLLTGKYDDGHSPKNSRRALFSQFLGRYVQAGEAFLDCNRTARELGLTPTQFALKFVESRKFVASNIIGATTMAQLEDNIAAHNIEWTDEMEKQAHRIHKTYRSPAA